jgi:low density lipoprotein receptor-related protein 5/6
MYYSDTRCCIWKAKLDGTDPVLVIADISHIKDITIDFDNSKLYWIDNDVIYNSNLDGSDVKMILNSSATGISIINSTLYWTQSNMQGVGSILSYSFVTNVTNTVLQMANLVPGDISSIISKSYIQSINVGCSNNNGGCKKFCFTLPQSSNVFAVSSNFTCSCPTGFKLLADGVSCNLVPESFLLIAANKKINIVSFDIPSESNIYLPLPIDISGTVEYVAYDLTNEFVYWSQQEPPAILRSKIDGSAREVIVNTSIALPVGVAISDDGSTLFWADVALNKIEAVAVSFVSNDHRRKTIVDTGLDHPQGLAINEALGYIYWTDSGIHPDIKRANLDGSNQVQIITSNVMLPGPLAIHRSTGNIYWSERHHGGQAIWKANKDGGNRVKLTNLGTNDFRGLSFIGDVLYISDRSNGIVKKLNIKSSIDTSPDVVADSLQHPLGITAINDTAALNHYGCLYPTNGGCGDICVPTGGSNSSAICICRDNYTLTDNGKDCAEGSDSLLIISSVNEVLMAKIPVAQISIPISVRSFDIDINNNKIYWINNSDGSLYRTDLPSFPITGSTLTVDISEYTIERLIESIAGSNISDLAVDWWGKNIYWTDSVRGLVGVSKLNGKNQQILASGLQNPRHIVIDPYLSNLYVSTDIGIQYVPLSGGAVTTLWTSPTNHEIKGLTIDIDEHFLFWTYDICLYEFRLLVHSDSSPIWCNYNHNDMSNDGPSPTIISYLKDKVYALLPTSHEVYEIDEHASEDSNDVSFRELGSWSLLFDHFTNHEVTGMKFHHFTVQPGSHWCTRSNGECSGDDTLCLVKDLYYYKCVCPSNTYQSVVYDQDREICRTHCNSKCLFLIIVMLCSFLDVESFLLFSTITDIMHLPVRDPALASFENSEGCPPSSLQPRPLNLGIVSDVKSITYDPLITRHVVWIEGRQVRSAGLDGSSPITLATYPYTLLPSSMTNDWYGGHILWTDDLLPYIDILRFNGRGSGVLLNEQQQRYNVTAIAMDSFKRYLYFANSFDLSLNSMNFGTSSLSIHKANIRKKAYITQMSYEHNNNTLCWYDELNKSIDVFFITTKNLITIVGNVVNSSHVTGESLYNCCIIDTVN